MIVHLLNLDTVGGVENLFSHYIHATRNLHHHLICTGRKPHPAFMQALHDCQSILFEKSSLGRILPERLRKLRRTRWLEKLAHPHLLYWNRMENTPPAYPATYYEHGAAWMGVVSEGKKHFLSECQQHIAVSYAAKRMLELRWGLTQDISIICNPIRPDVHSASHAKELAESRPLRLGFIGRLVPLKGAHILLHALKIVRDMGISAELHIAGEGAEKQSLLQLAHKLALSDSVIFAGHIASITNWYDKIDIVIIPSIREPLGLVALEAQARAVPVIASAVDGLFEVTSAGIQIAPTEPISSYVAMTRSRKGLSHALPEAIYDPLHDQLAPPRALNPQHIADSVVKIVQSYYTYSQSALLSSLNCTNFNKYVQELNSVISFF